MDYAANLANFLMDEKNSVLAQWSGRMTAKQQRALFGAFLGKGLIEINGADETVCHYVKVCFGLDSECTKTIKWSAL
jgi:hypothetical protein